MILLLICIPAIAFGAGIDWSTCESKTNCFVLANCETPSETTVKLVQIQNDITCGIGFQVNFFTEDVALLQIQVEAKMENVVPELSIYHGDKALVGCKKNETGNIEVIGDVNMIKNHEIELFEDRTAFGSDRSICSVKLENMDTFQKSMKQNFPSHGTQSARIGYLNEKAEPVFIPYAFAGVMPYLSRGENSIQCDPYSFQSRQELTNFHVLPIRNRDKKILDCTNYVHLNYDLRLTRDNVVSEITSLECTDTHEYVVNVPNVAADQREILRNPHDIEIFCATPIGRVCENPFANCPSTGCPKFTPGTNEADANLECTDNKWMIDGVYHTLKDAEKPVCREDDVPNKAAFFIKFASGDEIRLDGSVKASCFAKYDCAIKSVLDYSDCKRGDDAACGVLEYENGKMKCEDAEKFTLSVMEPNSNTSLPAQEYDCDGGTGKWKDVEGVSPREGAQVRCFGDVGIGKRVATFTDSDMKMIIALVVVGSLVGIAAVIFCICQIVKRRKLKHVRAVNKKKWKKMKGDQRLRCIKSTFNDIMSATCDSAVHIVHGFDAFEMLLSTNTEDPEIWEVVYPFLLRVKCALVSVDFNLSQLYARYLYLQAKKIIDEHGWLSPTQITKSNHNGFIRSVAIQLISLCAYDRFNDEIVDFVETGYRKLGFNAVAQYPHCGLMWSLMTQIRSYCYDHTTDATMKDRGLNLSKFLMQLNHIAEKPPPGLEDADVIPQFGSISDQANFAIGGTKDGAWLTDLYPKIFKRVKSTDQAIPPSRAPKFLAGAGHTITHDPGTKIFNATNQFLPENMAGDDKKNLVGFHDILRSIAPIHVWNAIADEIIKIMIFAQRTHDAKKLQSLIMPDAQQTTDNYVQLRAEQEQFEEAVVDQTKELWTKFARIVDMDELKQRPELIKHTLADFESPLKKNAGEKPVGTGSVKTNSASSLSPSKSSASNATEQEPAAAAATAAASGSEAAAAPAEAPAAL